MANLVTLIRFILLFPLVISAYWAPPSWQVFNAPLLILIIALDGLDGYIARRRNETSVFGSIFDIASDRVIENVLWVVLAHLGLVPIWVAIVFLVRGSIVDSIRYAAISRGQAAMATMRGQLGLFLVEGRFMRGLYGAIKAVTFSWLLLIQPLPDLFPAWWQENNETLWGIGAFLIYSSVFLCILRGIPVIVEFITDHQVIPRKVNDQRTA